MSSIKDLWDVDTLAYKEFERMFECYLLGFFDVFDRFEDFRPFEMESRMLSEMLLATEGLLDASNPQFFPDEWVPSEAELSVGAVASRP
eukprot:6107324-Alexandrium_andersonii.AAC.1